MCPLWKGTLPTRLHHDISRVVGGNIFLLAIDEPVYSVIYLAFRFMYFI
jgi:hypothetical protein